VSVRLGRWVRSVRGRLALWHAAALAVTVITLCFAGGAVLRRLLEARVDRALVAAADGAAEALREERREGEPAETAAASVAQEALTARQGVAVFDARGRRLAQRPLPGLPAPPWSAPPSAIEVRLSTFAVDGSRRLRLATRRLDDLDDGYTIVVFESMDEVDRDLALARWAALVVLPLACALTALAGWAVAGRTLRPVLSMSRDVRALTAADLRQRIAVPNPDDELGHLAQTFNELLARLEAAFDRQRQFMADASHELRTPLSVVRTAASLSLQRPERAETEYRETLAVIAGQADRASRLVDDLFLLARADAGQYPVRPRPVDLGEIVLDCVDAMRVLSRTRGVSVRTTEGLLAQEAPYLADEELLRRMLVNLIENAVAHTPDQGVVSVDLLGGAQGYTIAVTDHGAGIPTADRDRVFERFYRGDAEERPSRNGAGLGLAISRWIAEAHGGSLTLAEGPGCTFVARLPGVPGSAD
jgi:heavy metal sensor kinase